MGPAQKKINFCRLQGDGKRGNVCFNIDIIPISALNLDFPSSDSGRSDTDASLEEASTPSFSLRKVEQELIHMSLLEDTALKWHSLLSLSYVCELLCNKLAIRKTSFFDNPCFWFNGPSAKFCRLKDRFVNFISMLI